MYGAFRMYVKVLLMWDSKIQIDGGGKDVVLASMLEARNLVVLRVCCLTSENIIAKKSFYSGSSVFLLVIVTAWISNIFQCCFGSIWTRTS